MFSELIDSLISNPIFITIGTAIVFGINFILAIGLIFLERRDAQSIWAWLLVLFFLPIVGFILYLLFGGTIHREKIFGLDKSQESDIEQLVNEQLEALNQNTFTLTDPMAEKHRQQIHMLLYNNQSFVTANNDIETFVDMEEKFDSLIKDIEEAKDHVNVQYYSIKLDNIGTRVCKALLKKQREGVQVRVLFDDMGSTSLARKHFRELIDAGGFVEAFFPSRLPLLNPRMNYRNHRKIAVVDGKIGYVGGSNLEDKYLGRDKKMGAWRDTHLRIVGGAVQALQLRFMMDWNSHNGKNNMTEEERYFPEYYFTGDTTMQISSSGPDEAYQEIKYGYLKMFYSARKTIHIQTPYFVPDQSVTEALRVALLSGVKVRIMIPSFPDHPFVYWGTYANVGHMAKLGAEVYMYTPGFFHPKVISIDDEVVSVGTTNIDNRSFLLNFEVNTFIYDSKEAEHQRKIFENDINYCEPLTVEKYENRSTWIRLKEGMSNLLSPLL